MFDTICGFIPVDPDYSPRTRRLDILRRVLDGTLYDVLPFEFHDERSASGEYIPLRNRRPSVRYPLARIVVDDSVSLVFGDGHFPTMDSEDGLVRKALADISKEAGLNRVMLEAALRGSIGSAAIQVRVLRGRVFLQVLDATYLTPEWDAEAPDTLKSVTEAYKVPGRLLAAQGYQLDETSASYWFMRRWDAETETWYEPWPVGQAREPLPDPSRTVRHGLGFVPIVWIRNLPGGDAIDGACTFSHAIATSIEIDYQLSQAGRGLKYSSDPTLLIREPAGLEGELIRGGGNALVVSEKGDAKLLEIGGTAASTVIEYVRTLRELALEGVHGNRASAERLSAAQSGRALEMMNQGLIWLADNLRVSYGTGLLELARMIIRASNRYGLRTHEESIAPLNVSARVGLKWPRWYAPTSEDRMRDAQTLRMLRASKEISAQTALKSIADVYDIEDVPAELARINSEEDI
ncbi:MAG: phage portal protein [Bryobacteraceae bacterium]|nr:phage portal protein [Bryobacteraceae bacterium]